MQQPFGLGLLYVPLGEIHHVPQLGVARHFVVFGFRRIDLPVIAEGSHQSSRKLLEAFGAFREQRIADGTEHFELLHHFISAKVGRVNRIVAHFHAGHLLVALVHLIDEFDGL